MTPGYQQGEYRREQRTVIKYGLWDPNAAGVTHVAIDGIEHSCCRTYKSDNYVPQSEGNLAILPVKLAKQLFYFEPAAANTETTQKPVQSPGSPGRWISESSLEEKIER